MGALAAAGARVPAASAATTPFEAYGLKRVSTTSNGGQANGDSDVAAISADGSRVAFTSYASNLVPRGSYVANVYVKNVKTGKMVVANTDAKGRVRPVAYKPRISNDGTKVSFIGSPKLASHGNDGKQHLYVKNLRTGAIVLAAHAEALSFPSMSHDGTKVSYLGLGGLVPGDAAHRPDYDQDIVAKDVVTGAVTRLTEQLGLKVDPAKGIVGAFSLSTNGRRIVFATAADGIAPGDTNHHTDSFVWALDAKTVRRVSTAANGTQGNERSYGPTISGSGKRVAFWSDADNLVKNDTNNGPDTFVKDLATGRIVLASRSRSGTQGTGRTRGPTLSASGKKVAFVSRSKRLAPNDTNKSWDVYVAKLS